jgi:hypothetical protein
LTRDSPRQEPLAKKRKLSEEVQPRGRLETEGPADVERDGQASVERLEWESKYVGILATEVCRVKDEGREECLEFCTFHGRKLLERYRTAIPEQRCVLHA